MAIKQLKKENIETMTMDFLRIATRFVEAFNVYNIETMTMDFLRIATRCVEALNVYNSLILSFSPMDNSTFNSLAIAIRDLRLANHGSVLVKSAVSVHKT